jgi:ribosome-associated translation inhibitor RaiA
VQLTVRDECRQFSPQTHAYAEYFAFSSLVGHDAAPESVTVTLTRERSVHGEDDDRVVCTVAVRMESGAVAEAHAVERHAYAAIERAVSLIRPAPATCITRPPSAARSDR